MDRPDPLPWRRRVEIEKERAEEAEYRARMREDRAWMRELQRQRRSSLAGDASATLLCRDSVFDGTRRLSLYTEEGFGKLDDEKRRELLIDTTTTHGKNETSTIVDHVTTTHMRNESKDIDQRNDTAHLTPASHNHQSLQSLQSLQPLQPLQPLQSFQPLESLQPLQPLQSLQSLQSFQPFALQSFPSPPPFQSFPSGSLDLDDAVDVLRRRREFEALLEQEAAAMRCGDFVGIALPPLRPHLVHFGTTSSAPDPLPPLKAHTAQHESHQLFPHTPPPSSPSLFSILPPSLPRITRAARRFRYKM